MKREEHGYELYALGEDAVVIRWNAPIGELALRLADETVRRLRDHRPAAVREWVRAYTTVAVYYDPWLVHTDEAALAGSPPQGRPRGGAKRADDRSPYERMCDWLEHLLAGIGEEPLADPTLEPIADPAGKARAEENAAGGSAEVVVPVCFGGDFGPDLEAVARAAGMSPEEAVRMFCAATYTVHMIGFLPGFPYLGGLPEPLAAPRLAQPRPAVPAGSVGVAGRQAGIYPLDSPGGWRLLGRTPLVLFDAGREPPSLLKAGDRVRFEPVPEARFAQMQTEREAGDRLAQPAKKGGTPG